jgi:hypothetical protein
MSQIENKILVEMQRVLSPSLTQYTDLIHNQSVELGLDHKKFWIDNPHITTYHYIRMLNPKMTITGGVLPSSRQMSKP